MQSRAKARYRRNGMLVHLRQVVREGDGFSPQEVL
jgi:hypothetical protein